MLDPCSRRWGARWLPGWCVLLTGGLAETRLGGLSCGEREPGSAAACCLEEGTDLRQALPGDLASRCGRCGFGGQREPQEQVEQEADGAEQGQADPQQAIRVVLVRRVAAIPPQTPAMIRSVSLRPRRG
jgi:hypothetical protein